MYTCVVVLKPQDVVVVLKLVGYGESRPSFAQIASDLSMSFPLTTRSNSNPECQSNEYHKHNRVDHLEPAYSSKIDLTNRSRKIPE